MDRIPDGREWKHQQDRAGTVIQRPDRGLHLTLKVAGTFSKNRMNLKLIFTSKVPSLTHLFLSYSLIPNKFVFPLLESLVPGHSINPFLASLFFLPSH